MLTAAWLISLVLANYVGGVVGFSQGLRTHGALLAGDMESTVAALRLLRQASYTEAIPLLEAQLDAQIAEHVFGEHAYRSPYNLFQRFVFGERPLKDEAYQLRVAFEYREEYPPVSGDSSVNEKVMRALEKYRNAPKP
jgi:hypothetical protein